MVCRKKASSSEIAEFVLVKYIHNYYSCIRQLNFTKQPVAMSIKTDALHQFSYQFKRAYHFPK